MAATGILLPIHPAKGCSLTTPAKDASKAHQVSLADDECKLVFSRLTARPTLAALDGDCLRIVGMAGFNGCDLDLNRVFRF